MGTSGGAPKQGRPLPAGLRVWVRRLSRARERLPFIVLVTLSQVIGECTPPPPTGTADDGAMLLSHAVQYLNVN